MTELDRRKSQTALRVQIQRWKQDIESITGDKKLLASNSPEVRVFLEELDQFKKALDGLSTSMSGHDTDTAFLQSLVFGVSSKAGVEDIVLAAHDQLTVDDHIAEASTVFALWGSLRSLARNSEDNNLAVLGMKEFTKTRFFSGFNLGKVAKRVIDLPVVEAKRSADQIEALRKIATKLEQSEPILRAIDVLVWLDLIGAHDAFDELLNHTSRAAVELAGHYDLFETRVNEIFEKYKRQIEVHSEKSILGTPKYKTVFGAGSETMDVIQDYLRGISSADQSMNPVDLYRVLFAELPPASVYYEARMPQPVTPWGLECESVHRAELDKQLKRFYRA